MNQELLPNQFGTLPQPEVQPGIAEVEFDFIAWEVELEVVSSDISSQSINSIHPEAAVAPTNELYFDFDAWEAELEDVDLEEQAVQAFKGLLTFETENEGETRTINDIKNDIFTFMSNPEIVKMQNFVEQAAAHYAQFCNHNHVGAESMNEGLSGIFGDIINSSEEVSHAHEHDHGSGHEHDDDDDDEDELDGKKKKKKRRK